ncbi:MAG TPA: HEAT repeat domain-containing protein [Pyrinomonadaceae bacterium]
MLHKNQKQLSIKRRRLSFRFAALTVIALSGLLLAGVLFNSSFAQQEDKLYSFAETQNPAAAKLFREGRDSIGEEDWKKAEGKFRSFVNLYPKDKNVDAALYWLAFALSKQGKSREADDQLRRLLANFPRSEWGDDATALRAQMNVDQRAVAQALNEEDVEVKIVALQSLFESNTERGLAYVAEMMKPGSKASPRLKEAGIELLRRYGGKQAVSMLLDVIRNQTDSKLRATAIHTLGRTGDESVLPLLKDLAINSTDEEVAKAAIFAISRFDGEQSRAMLLEMARGGKSVEVRKDAIFWLSHHGDAALDDLMKIYAADRDANIRKQIVFVLKRIGSPRSLAKLYEIASGGDDVEVRKDAFHWIGQSGDDKSLDFLIQTYDSDREEEIKKQIIFALSRTGDKRAIRKMIDIARRDPSVELRKQAIFWLGRSSDPEAQKFLEDLLK